MSRSSASAASRRGGELVDVGSWDAPPPAAAAPPSQARIATGSAGTAHAHAHSAAAAGSSANPSARSGGKRGADHWLHTEPVTLGVDKASDRPLYCLSVNERLGSFVTGGADHSLRVYDLSSGSLRRELYSKTSGHTEWVTTCASLPDGRVLSGSMDSKLVLWASSGPRGVDLVGHSASISRVMADSRDIGLSGSYDRTLRVWSLASRSPRELSVLRGCAGPVTAMDWHNSLVLAGTREGQVGMFDLNTGARLRWLSPAGNAQVLTLQLGSIEAGVAAASSDADAIHDPAAYSWIAAAGGSDGWLRLYDLRSEGCIFQKRLSAGNPGSVNDVSFARGRMLVALADGHACLLDPRAGFATASALGGHQAPVQCVRAAPSNHDVSVSAASNGWLLVHDLLRADQQAQCPPAYALGLTTVGGVNAMWVGNDKVVAVGDDGQPTILQY